MAANPREGFRSETLARFALSAFGPATDVEVEDDYGVDLVCATSRRVGQRLHVGSGYLVQVKSQTETEVTYSGEHTGKWLEDLGSPLLVCRVDKAAARIELYSTWNISRVLHQIAAYSQASPETFWLILDQPVSTDEPSPNAIPLGIPIVAFSVTELHDSEKVNTLRTCIEEWVRMDSQNILWRRIGLAVAFGYTKWETNRPPSHFNNWYHPYYYSAKVADRAREILVECAALIALTHKTNKVSEVDALRSYANMFCTRTEELSFAFDVLKAE